MVIGFITNFFIGIIAYLNTAVERTQAAARSMPPRWPAITAQNSAGTFATCVDFLNVCISPPRAYMPVMLAVMEIPGCLVALFLVSRLHGQSAAWTQLANMPGRPWLQRLYARATSRRPLVGGHGEPGQGHGNPCRPAGGTEPALMPGDDRKRPARPHFMGFINVKLLHELFLNQGLYLLLGGIVIGIPAGLQAPGQEIPRYVEDVGGRCLFPCSRACSACSCWKWEHHRLQARLRDLSRPAVGSCVALRLRSRRTSSC